MQNIHLRFFVLIALFVSSVLAFGIVEPSNLPAAPRWPDQDSLYQVEGWQTTAPKVELANGTEYVTRDYDSLTGQRATLTISTSPVAKRVYRAGAEVPFLGNGYVVEPAPHTLASTGAAGGALVARKGDQSWLQIHVYGERRGQFGTGALAWALSVVDTMAGYPNDYYLLRIVVPFNDGDERELEAAESLAGTLFPRVGAWYAGV
jgi:hypothetical protein